MLITEETQVIDNWPFPPESVSCFPALRTMYSITYLYIICFVITESFYVVRLVFQSLKYSWQTAPYTSTTIATLSTKGMFSFLVFHFELIPFSDGQLSKVSARPTVFIWKNVIVSSNLLYHLLN